MKSFSNTPTSQRPGPANPVQAIRGRARDFYIHSLLGSSPVWRFGLNARRTSAFIRNAPVLNDEAARVLSDLNRDGAARTTLEALTGNAELLGVLQAEAKRLEELKTEELEQRRKRLADKNDIGDGNDKVFVVTMLDHDRPVIDPDGLLAGIALDTQLKGIADHYYGLRTRVTDINIWRNLPTGRDAIASQLWHRDQPEDHLILKMFLYLEDVPEGAGPFTYVKGTHGKGDRKWGPPATFDGHNWRASDADMETSVEEARRPRFTGPAGTILLADTVGWHRGGHATTTSRFVMQVLFASSAALPDRLLGVPTGLDLSSAPRDLAYDTRKK